MKKVGLSKLCSVHNCLSNTQLYFSLLFSHDHAEKSKNLHADTFQINSYYDFSFCSDKRWLLT